MPANRTALIDADGVVQNVTLVDPEVPFDPTPLTLVNIEERTCVGGEPIGPGCTYDGAEFTAGILPEDVPATNRATLRDQVPQALEDLDTLVNNTTTLIATLAQEPNTDLQGLRLAVLQIADGMVTLARNVKVLDRLAVDLVDEVD